MDGILRIGYDTRIKLKLIVQGGGGFLVSALLSILSPLITVPALKLLAFLGFLSTPIHVPNTLYLILVAIISLVVPLGVFAMLRNRVPPFSWGLLIGVLVIGLPGYLIIVGTAFLVNY